MSHGRQVFLHLASRKLFLVQERGNTMRQLSQDYKPYHREYFQRSITRLQLVKEKRLKDTNTCTRTSFNKRDGEKKPEKVFPLIIKKKKEKRTRAKSKWPDWEFPVSLRVYNLTAVQTSYWCIQISRNQQFLACNLDFVLVTHTGVPRCHRPAVKMMPVLHVHSWIFSHQELSSLTQIQTKNFREHRWKQTQKTKIKQ